MKTFIKALTVTKDDLDDLNHVNNVRYVDWVNTVAKSHWEEKISKNIRENFFWVLISHTIHYKKPAFLNDEILLKTFITKAEGVTSTRMVEIYNSKHNSLLAKSETKWCFINSKTLKPARITEDFKKLFS